MNIAFHFDVDAIQAKYPKQLFHLPVLEKIFRNLLNSDLRYVHLKIYNGDLLIWDYIHGSNDEEKIKKILEGLVGNNFSIWRDIGSSFYETIISKRVFVIAMEGVSQRLRGSLLHGLKQESSYVGAIQIYGANEFHWGLYGQALIPQYRYIDKELRILHSTLDQERDTDLEEHWQRLPFKSISWEDLGLRHSIFDTYGSFDHAKRLAELSDNLSDQLLRLADDILLRTGDLNPDLQNELHAAFRDFNFIQTSADIAHVAISCRRFLEHLANALYSTIEGTEPLLDEKGKPFRGNISLEKFRRYTKERLGTLEHERKLVLAELDSLDARLQKVTKLANTGIHDKISFGDLDRLLVALVTVTYDILSLASPPNRLPIEPYEEAFIELVNEVRESHQTKREKE